MNLPGEWRPLLRWDGTHLVAGLASVNRLIQRAVADSQRLRSLAISGDGDRLRLTARVEVAGLEPEVVVDLREVRFRHGCLGFRITRLAALGGLRLPRAVIEEALERSLPEGVTAYRSGGIVVLDLSRWMPPELDLRILAMQVVADTLQAWVGPGSLTSLPGPAAPRLAAGSTAT